MTPKINCFTGITAQIIKLPIVVIEIDNQLPVLAPSHDDEVTSSLDMVPRNLGVDSVARRMVRTLLKRPPK